MRVDTKPVKTDTTKTLGKEGMLAFQTSLNYLDLGDLLIIKKKPNQNKKKPKKEKKKKKNEKTTSCQREHMYDS